MRLVLLACGGVLVLGIASRYPPLAAALPTFLGPVIAALVGSSLLVVGVIERRTPRGTVGPLWMRVSRPIAACLALGLSYFTTVIAQVLGWSLGPVDPTFPAAAHAGIETMWFFIFTIGFVGIGMMSAPSLMVPLLRVLTWPVKSTTLAVAVPVSLGIGAVFALGVFAFAALPDVAALVARGRAWFDANQTVGTLALVAIAVIPNLLPASKD